jgi:hypothetical protein
LDGPCHLLTYAAPITRRMLQFNNLDYYAIPPLPYSFKAPIWLKVELGIFAGRLYFEWDEYKELKSYLSIHDPTADSDDGGPPTVLRKAFATKPLVFLHKWLAIRRKGHDFEHTPMGFITIGKPLSAGHSFVAAVTTTDNADAKHFPVLPGRVTRAEVEHEESDDEDEDHAKEHLFQHDDEQEVFHDAEEEMLDEQDNTFFDGKAYGDAEEGDE